MSEPTLTPTPGCALCAQLRNTRDLKPFRELLAILRKADQLRCHCSDAQHLVLIQHPHTQHGCQGFPEGLTREEGP